MSDSVTKYFENASSSSPIKTEQVDRILENVIRKYNNRSKVGINKYGTTLEESKEDTIAFIRHLQEEMMDATLYCEKLLKLMNNAN